MPYVFGHRALPDTVQNLAQAAMLQRKRVNRINESLAMHAVYTDSGVCAGARETDS